jgi:DNA anti-recombination protein RmuC
MEIVLIVLVAVLLIVNVFVVYKLAQPREVVNNASHESLLLLQQQLQEMSRTMDARLGQTTNRLYESLKDQTARSQELMQSINKEMNEQLRSVVKEVTAGE